MFQVQVMSKKQSRNNPDLSEKSFSVLEIRQAKKETVQSSLLL